MIHPEFQYAVDEAARLDRTIALTDVVYDHAAATVTLSAELAVRDLAGVLKHRTENLVVDLAGVHDTRQRVLDGVRSICATLRNPDAVVAAKPWVDLEEYQSVAVPTQEDGAAESARLTESG